MAYDALDSAILRTCLEHPKLGVLETSRRLHVARGTVQARLERLERDGVLDWTPHVSPAALGYVVEAFTTLVVHQRQGVASVREHLESVPEVVQAFTITGSGDVLCHLVARNHAELQRVLDLITSSGLVERTATSIVLTDGIGHRTEQLLKGETFERPPGSSGRPDRHT